jgi:hypothetical protein
MLGWAGRWPDRLLEIPNSHQNLQQLAAPLWRYGLANWLLAGDQVHFVQARIRSSRAATVSEKL